MASFVVVGPLAVARAADGKQRYLYKDAPMPDDIPAEEIDRLVAIGLVAEDNADGPKPAKQSAATKKSADAKAAAEQKAADEKAAADAAAKTE